MYHNIQVMARSHNKTSYQILKQGPGGEPTKVKCNYIWANVGLIIFAQM